MRDKPQFTVDPHHYYRWADRAFFAFLGTLVPVGTSIINSGVLRKLDEGFSDVGWTFVGVAVIYSAFWIAGVLVSAEASLKDRVQYAFYGTLIPANFLILSSLLQKVQ